MHFRNTVVDSVSHKGGECKADRDWYFYGPDSFKHLSMKQKQVSDKVLMHSDHIM